MLTAGADSLTTDFEYDDDGLVTKAGPLTITRAFDNGDVEKIADTALTADYAYDAIGRMAEVAAVLETTPKAVEGLLSRARSELSRLLHGDRPQARDE